MKETLEDGKGQNGEFLKYFPEATVENVETDKVPAEVVKIFERGWMIDWATVDQEKFGPRKWDSPFVIRHKDGSTTYCAAIKGWGNGSEIEYVFVDTVEGSLAGYGEINPKEFSRIRPSVGFTETTDQFRRRGLGTRRLLMMNAFSREHFKTPLRSADLEDTELEARAVWEKLVKEGRATKYKEGVMNRYVLVDKDAEFDVYS